MPTAEEFLANSPETGSAASFLDGDSAESFLDSEDKNAYLRTMDALANASGKVTGAIKSGAENVVQGAKQGFWQLPASVNRAVGLESFPGTQEAEQQAQAAAQEHEAGMEGSPFWERVGKSVAYGLGQLGATLPVDVAMGGGLKALAPGAKILEAIPSFALGMGVRKAGDEGALGFPEGVAEGLAMHGVGGLGQSLPLAAKLPVQAAGQGALAAGMTTADSLAKSGQLPTAEQFLESAATGAAMGVPFSLAPGKMGVNERSQGNTESVIPDLARTDPARFNFWDRINGTAFDGSSPGNRMTTEQLAAKADSNSALSAFVQTYSDLVSAGHIDIAGKLSISSLDQGEHAAGSKHPLGLALDFHQSRLTPEERNTFYVFAAQNGLSANVKGEPWHLSYVGPGAKATQVVTSNTPTDILRVTPPESQPTGDVPDFIVQAANQFGVDPDFLYRNMMAESGGRNDAAAATSSARGLWQFTDGDWKDLSSRPELQALGVTADRRNDPMAQALAAAFTTKRNADILRQTLGREPTDADLYMTAFLGSSGGPTFLTGLAQNPSDAAINHASAAAVRANHSIFYGPSGRARSLAEVYDLMAGKVQGGNRPAATALQGIGEQPLRPELAALRQDMESRATGQDIPGGAPSQPDAAGTMDLLNGSLGLANPLGRQAELYSLRQDIMGRDVASRAADEMGAPVPAVAAERLGALQALPPGGQDFAILPDAHQQAVQDAQAARDAFARAQNDSERNQARQAYQAALAAQDQARQAALADAARQGSLPGIEPQRGQQETVVPQPEPTVQAPAHEGPVVPEPRAYVDAQVRAMADPRSEKKAVLITPGTPFPSALPKGTHAFVTEHGTVLTLDPTLRDRLPYNATDAQMGDAVLNYAGGRPLDPRKGVVIRALDEKGVPVGEVHVDKADKVQAMAAMKGLSPVDKAVMVPLRQALADRVKGLERENIRPQEEPQPLPLRKEVPSAVTEKGNPVTRQSLQKVLADTPFHGAIVLDSPADIPDRGLRDYMERTGNLGAKGVYDIQTGKAYVFAGNHADMADALVTARDEMFHRGIFRWAEQQAKADPKSGPAFKQLNAFMNTVRQAKRTAVNDWLEKNGYGELKDSNYGANEWLTHAASYEAPHWYDRYVAAVLKYAREFGKAVGFDFKLTDAEIRDWSRRVAERMGEETQLMGKNPRPLEQRTYQGSPTRGIERMDDAYLGTGEGGRRETNNDYSGMFGWGHYSAQEKKVAERYRDNLSKDYAFVDGKKLSSRTKNPDDAALFNLISTTFYSSGALENSIYDKINSESERLKSILSDARAEGSTMFHDGYPIIKLEHDIRVLDSLSTKKVKFVRGGGTYQLEVPDSDKLMDWDKPLSEQPEAVKEKLSQVDPQNLVMMKNGEFRDMTGKDFYKAMAKELGSPKAASQYLDSIGIPGHQYLDAGSRGDGEGTHNIVTYSDKNIDITGTFYRKQKFDDAEQERRWQEGQKGIGGGELGVIDRAKAKIEQIKNGFTRHFINLPVTEHFARAQEWFRQLESAPEFSQETAIRSLEKITKGLTPAEFDVFQRKVVLDDFAHGASEGVTEFPFGMTATDVARENLKYANMVMTMPKVAEALKTRRETMDAIGADLVRYGILRAEQLKNPAYFRHEVLKYARDYNQAVGTGKEIRKPKPGYSKQRTWSNEDISSNYLEVDGAFMMRAGMDIATAKMIEKVKKSDYNIKDQLVAQAKAENEKWLRAAGINPAGLKPAEIRQAMGKDFKTWRDFIPDTHTTWQADKGLLYHSGTALSDHVAMDALDAMSDPDYLNVAPNVLSDVVDGMRKALMVSGRKPEMVLPTEMVKTLQQFKDPKRDTLLQAAAAIPLGKWKQWILLNPRRVLKYNLNNMSGDLDAVIAGNIHALKKLGPAVRELWQVMKGKAEPSQRYLEASERGVFNSGLSIQEIPEIKSLDPFQKLLSDKKGFSGTKSALMKMWRASKDYTQFRENWLRYAAYLDYAERLDAGESMDSIGYGAAHKALVDGLDDNRDKAAVLARSLVGDYGSISHYGQDIRRTIIPFYSWLEVNTARYSRLFRNAFAQSINQGLKTGGIAGLAVGAKTAAWLGIRYAMVNGMIYAWNNMMFPDEEKELPKEDQAQLHVLLGRDADGNIRSLRLQGALSDFLGWIGYNDVVSLGRDIASGNVKFKDVAKAPVNRIVSGLTPVFKTPLEMITGNRYFPDVFRPRPIDDRWREFARMFSAENEYDAIVGNPSRGYLNSWVGSVTYNRNPGEMAYNETRSLIRDFKESKGEASSGFSTSPKAEIAKDYKLALRYGDAAAEKKAKAKMLELGMDKDEIDKVLLRAAPLAGLPLNERQEFLASLDTRDKNQVEKADKWFRETYLSDRQEAKYDLQLLKQNRAQILNDYTQAIADGDRVKADEIRRTAVQEYNQHIRENHLPMQLIKGSTLRLAIRSLRGKPSKIERRTERYLNQFDDSEGDDE